MTEVSKTGQSQAYYYSTLLKQHGHGVDAVASGLQIYKETRYSKLCGVFGEDNEFSLHDIGFGLGHLYEFLNAKYPERHIAYSGSEITPHFIESCRSNYPECSFIHRDISVGPFQESYDYVVFGGTFYHLAGSNPEEYFNYMKRSLANAFVSCNKGMAFNLITSYVDHAYEHLFYPPVGVVIDFIVRNLSRFFALDHAYPLFEHTILVYKEEHISGKYSDPAFDKYFPLRSVER